MRRYSVLRGGSAYNTGYLRTTIRIWYVPEYRGRDYGFRIVVSRGKL
jgi:formylglycine-generating enzyme required for sulfatase activity